MREYRGTDLLFWGEALAERGCARGCLCAGAGCVRASSGVAFYGFDACGIKNLELKNLFFLNMQIVIAI